MYPVALGATQITNEILKDKSLSAIGCVTSNKVHITISENGNYALSLYSLDGRQIQVIKNDFFRKNSYSISWDSDMLSKQVYVIRLEGNGYNIAKKVFFK